MKEDEVDLRASWRWWCHPHGIACDPSHVRATPRQSGSKFSTVVVILYRYINTHHQLSKYHNLALIFFN
jgi:hypothetical protein